MGFPVKERSFSSAFKGITRADVSRSKMPIFWSIHCRLTKTSQQANQSLLLKKVLGQWLV